MRGEPGVPLPHPEERLAHRAKGVRYCRRSDGLFAGGDGTLAVELSKRLEVGEWIGIVKEGVDIEVGTVGLPYFPVGILGACSFGGDTTGDTFLNSDKCSLEYMLVGSGHSVHDTGCG